MEDNKRKDRRDLCESMDNSVLHPAKGWQAPKLKELKIEDATMSASPPTS